MADTEFKSVAIIGVGLLGGSLGLALKATGAPTRIVGVGHRRSSLRQALQAGTVDAVTLDPAEGASGADLVVLCTSVGRFEPILRAISPALAKGAIVTDVGSTKTEVVRLSERVLAGRAAFVGAHPMAGGERRGVAFARADLYAGRTCILTPTPRTPPRALKRVERFWQSIGMRTVRLSPAEHDRALARVSHLPHAVAALLVEAQGELELDLAGPGFVDATRIAGGDPAMWRDIFLSNRRAVTRAAGELERRLAAFRRLLEKGDGQGLQRLLASACQRRERMLRRRFRTGRAEE